MSGADISQWLGPSLAPLGFGGLAGAAVGYTAKKLSKLLALGLGLALITLQLLAYHGLVEVRWEQVQQTAEAAWVDERGVTLAQRAWEIVSANLPFGGAFAAGFALGFRLG